MIGPITRPVGHRPVVRRRLRRRSTMCMSAICGSTISGCRSPTCRRSRGSGWRDKPALILGMSSLRMFRRVEIDFVNREIAFTLPRPQIDFTEYVPRRSPPARAIDAPAIAPGVHRRRGDGGAAVRAERQAAASRAGRSASRRPKRSGLGFDDSRMTVPVSIGASGPYRFIIDTGAERTVVSRELAGSAQPRRRAPRARDDDGGAERARHLPVARAPGQPGPARHARGAGGLGRQSRRAGDAGDRRAQGTCRRDRFRPQRDGGPPGEEARAWRPAPTTS